MTYATPLFLQSADGARGFASMGDVRRFLADQVDVTVFVAYDAAGRRLQITGLGTGVAVCPAEEVPGHVEELRQLLATWLKTVDRLAPGTLADTALTELVARSNKHLTQVLPWEELLPWDIVVRLKPSDRRTRLLVVVLLGVNVALMAAAAAARGWDALGILVYITPAANAVLALVAFPLMWWRTYGRRGDRRWGTMVAALGLPVCALVLDFFSVFALKI